MSLKLAPSDYEIYIPIAEWIEKNIKEWLFTQRPLFKKLSAPIDSVLNGLDTLFNVIPFPLAILIFLYFAFKTNGFKFAILTLIGLVFFASAARTDDAIANIVAAIPIRMIRCFIAAPAEVVGR